MWSDEVSGHSVFRFANYCQDHAVLQWAPQKAVVQGFSDTNKHFTVWLCIEVYKTVNDFHPVNEFGKSIWSVTLDSQSNAGSNQINVHQTLVNGTILTITFKDVYFGDVWIYSGQPNMQMTPWSILSMSRRKSPMQTIILKKRLFTAAHKAFAMPAEELLSIVQNWSVAASGSIRGPAWSYTSTVCWLYGSMIHESLAGIPIGLVMASWVAIALELRIPSEPLHDCCISLWVNSRQSSVFLFVWTIHRSENVQLQPYEEPFRVRETRNNLNLFNAMIYSFTRMVIYGAIWYHGEHYSTIINFFSTTDLYGRIQRWIQS
jgi:sialate O-acetylesterase